MPTHMHHRPLPKQFQWPATLDLKRISRDLNVQVHDHATATYQGHSGITNVSLREGQLYIDGEHIPEATFGRNFVRFTHDTPQKSLTGVLSFSPDTHSATGTVFTGATAKTAQPLQVSAVADPTVYSTKVCKIGAAPPAGQKFPNWVPPEPVDPSQWVEGVELIMGYTPADISGTLPTPVYQLALPSGKGAQDLKDFIAPAIDPKTQNLLLEMTMSDPGALEMGFEDFGAQFPGAFITEISWDGRHLRGVMQHYDASKGILDPVQYAWHGIAKSSLKPMTAAQPASPHTVTATLTPRDSTAGLSIAELFTMQPDSKTLQDTQFDLILENMKWAMGTSNDTKDWLTNFFGETQPQGLDPNRESFIDQDSNFYLKRLAVAYLGTSINNYTGPGASSTKLTADQYKNLQFYLRAGLAAEKGYNNQSNGAFMEAFTTALPRLQEYIKDTSGNWAQQLFGQLTSPVQMNIIVSKILAGEGMDEANRHSTILRALQSSGDLATQYHSWIMATAMSQSVSFLNLDNSAAIQSWLGDSIQAFITAKNTGRLSQVAGSSATAGLAAGVAELEQAATASGGAGKLAALLADLAVEADDPVIWNKLTSVASIWSKAGYRFTQLTHVLAIAGGLMQSVIAFKDWKNIDDLAKTNSVLSIVDITGQLVESMPEIISSTQFGFAQIAKLRNGLASPNANEAMIKAIQSGETDAIGDGAARLRALANADQTGLNIGETQWSISFKETVGPICKCIAVAAAIAFAVTSTIQFVRDILDGKDTQTEALDGVIAAATIGIAVCTICELALGVTIPVIGALLAVIGFVAALVEMCDPPSPPPSPAEVFMQNQLLPAVSGPGRWVLDAPGKWNTDTPVPQNNAYTSQKAAAAG